MEFGLDPLELLVHAAVAIAAVYVVYTVTLSIFITEGGVRRASTNQGISDVYAKLPPPIVLRIRCVCALLMFALGYVAINTVAGLFLALGGYFLPLFLLQCAQARRLRIFETQLIDALELLSNSIKSGLTLQQSVELLVAELPAPISDEFSQVLAESRLGVDFIEALANLGNRINSHIVLVLASGVAVTKQCGGDLTIIFQNIATTIREQATIEGKLEAVTAQGRFQGLVLGVVPFALIVILYFVDKAHIQTLFGYQMGMWAVCLVIFMVVMAQVWIRRLLTIDV